MRDPKNGDRTSFNAGRHPLVSPDGQQVAFSDVGEPFPYWDGLACDVSRLTIRSLDGGPNVVLDDFRLPDGKERTPVQASATSWAPDSARFVVSVESYSDRARQSIYDPQGRNRV